MTTKVKKKKRGQPTKYKSEYCDLSEYLKSCKAKGDLPSICGYAVYLEVAENTVGNWGKKNEEFLRSLGVLKTISKQTLMNKGLKGKYNSTIAKLILSSNHGMTERLDATSGDKPIEKVIGFEDMMKSIIAANKSGTGIDNRSIEGANSDSQQTGTG